MQSNNHKRLAARSLTRCVPSSRGFTLIELMVTIGVLSILATVAVPTFQRVVQDSRLASSINGLGHALIMARSEAVERASGVQLCRRQTDSSCSTSADWSSGWLMIETAGGSVLQVWDAQGGGITITGPTAAVVFQASGLPSSSPAFDISLAGATAENRCVAVTPTGQVSSKKEAC